MCDRAVFTSLPSPTGEGYRIVASSSGLRAEEKVEIIRRAPSHGALCSGETGARGLTIATLGSGRLCLLLSRLAGAEHTGRGGRVWTDILMIAASDFLRAGGHPVTFGEALACSPLPATKLGSSIEKLTVPLPDDWDSVLNRLPPAAVPVNNLAAMAALLIERVACVVTAAEPVAALERALLLLPVALRGGLNASAGLRFSNSRQATFCVVDQIDLDIRRMTRGHAVTLLGADELAGRSLGMLAPWLSLMTRMWEEGRAAEAMALADALRGDCSLQQILEVARLRESVDRGEEKPEVLETVLSRLAGRPSGAVAAAPAIPAS